MPPKADRRPNLLPMIQFAGDVLRHKAFVLRAGIWSKAPMWRLLIHDLSKLSPAEWPHYARRLRGGGDNNLGFSLAWNHHQKANPHHWQYWVSASGHELDVDKTGNCLPMPEWAVREMVADWFAACRGGEGAWPRSRAEWPWLRVNLDALALHPETRTEVDRVLDETFAAMRASFGVAASADNAPGTDHRYGAAAKETD